jgi:hypothetical protein
MPAIASRAITFFITEPMSFIVGEPISEITALTRTGGSAYHAFLLSRGGPCKLGLGGDFLRVRAPSPWEGSQLTPSSAPSTATRPPPRFTAHPAAKAGWFQFEHTIRNWAEVGDGRTSPSSKYWTGQPLDPLISNQRLRLSSRHPPMKERIHTTTAVTIPAQKTGLS